MAERPTTTPNALPPDFELAGSLQATLSNIERRDFRLDLQQHEAIQAIGHALVEGTDSGYIEMATSTGKTVVEALLAEAAVRSGRRALILAPTIAIARQIIGKDQEATSGFERFARLPDNTKIRSHFGAKRGNKTADIVVATYLGFLNDAKNDHALLGSFDVLIADECHRSLGAETSKALKSSFPGAFKIGLSATPDYAVDRKSEEVYDRRLYDFSLINAVESGKTAPVRALVYETNEVIELDEDRAEFTDRELAPLITNLQRNGTALELTKSFIEEGRRGIVACIPGSSNTHARIMSQLFTQEGIRSMDVGSHLPGQEQTERLRAFERGEIDVLTFTRSLEEGWDSTQASFAINLAPTTSPVRTKQLLGRVLRKKHDGRESLYIDFIDEKLGIAKDQYTALHALDLEFVDIKRTLGTYTGMPTSSFKGDNSPFSTLSPRVVELLLRSHGKRIADILANKQQNPLQREWDRHLAKEGLPAELHPNMMIEAPLAARVDKARRRFVFDSGYEPHTEELIESMRDLRVYQTTLLSQFALRLPYEEGEYDYLPDESESVEEQVVDKLMYEYAENALHILSEQEAEAIRMHTGIYDGEPKSNIEIGEHFGLSRERTRQILSRGLSKVRNEVRERKPYQEQPLGERLQLYCGFNIRSPQTNQQARIAFALNSLEEFAQKRWHSDLEWIETPEQIHNVFRINQLWLPKNRDTINLCEYVLPVAKNLLEASARRRLPYETATLRHAVTLLTWLVRRPSIEQQHDVSRMDSVKILPDAFYITNTNVDYGIVKGDT